MTSSFEIFLMCTQIQCWTILTYHPSSLWLFRSHSVTSLRWQSLPWFSFTFNTAIWRWCDILTVSTIFLHPAFHLYSSLQHTFRTLQTLRTSQGLTWRSICDQVTNTTNQRIRFHHSYMVIVKANNTFRRDIASTYVKW